MSFTRISDSGRPRQTSCREDHYIVRNACIQPTTSSAAIQAHVPPSLGTHMSSRTIRRHLAEEHLGSRRPHDDNRVRVWRPCSERLNPAIALQRHIALTAGVMVWGVVAYNTPSPLALICITMIAQLYVHDILKPHVLPLMQRFPGAILQQDNARHHTAKSVISRLWQRFQDDGNVSRCYKTDRPRVTTPNEDRYLAVTAKRNRRSTASDLSRQFSSATGTTVSKQTVYRRLGRIGLYARRPVRCAPLTATHCRLQLTWSREHALWTPQQWSCVMFSDESRTDLHVQSVTMTGHIYRDVILEQHVHLFRGAMGSEFLFTDDNARPHRANIVDECLQSEDITSMD
ncbi:transposable element Tcb1 transposase [Trichonephila clavipes]|nr:transposable element Tcb1 transposase [Trichonephila clavipes]